jgi:putative spermidine/putrescine transport system permease protein
MNKKNKLLLLFPFIIILLLFLFLPILMMIWGSFQDETNSGVSFANYLEIFSKPFYYQAFRNSIIISVASAFIGIIGAFIISLSMLRLSENIQTKINYCLNIAANFAGVPLAFSFILLFGNSGVLRLLFEQVIHFDLYSWKGLALTYTYFQIPLGVIFIYPVIRKIRKEWGEAALLLGASKLSYWYKVLLPILSPSIIGTFILLFANGMGTYETAYALTASNFNLITIRISALSTGDVFAKPNLASALAIVFMLVMILIMVIAQNLMKKARNYQ